MSGAAATAPSSELRKRVLSGLVMGVAAIGVTIWGGWPFLLLWGLAAAAVAGEWQRMAHGAESPWIGRTAITATMLAGLTAWRGDFSTLNLTADGLFSRCCLGLRSGSRGGS